MKSVPKPPIVKSPLLLRPRRVIPSGAAPSLPGISSRLRNQSSATKFAIGRADSSNKKIEIDVLCETLEMLMLEEIAKSCSSAVDFLAGTSGSKLERKKSDDDFCGMRGEEICKSGSDAVAFSAARFYDVNSFPGELRAMRKQRVMKKIRTGDENEEPKMGCNVGVAKKEAQKKKATPVRLGDRSQHPRYALRSLKKPPLPARINII